MYTGLSYNRYPRPDDRYALWNDGNDVATPSTTTPSNPRRTRYTRSSTTSVAQLLSESCTTLLQKLTTKVRGPSEAARTTPKRNFNPLSTSKSTATIPTLGTTRTRLEDKYSSVLDKIYGRKREEKTVEPGPLSKSATTTYVPLSQYSNVSNREKTPFRNDAKYRKHYQEPPYAYLDQDSAYRVRYRTNHSELRPRRSSKPLRAGKSEAGDFAQVHAVPPPDDETTPTPSVPDPLTEREAKRKEIQSLIMKYSALDEVYNRGAGAVNGAVAAATKQNAATAIAKKYCPGTRLVAVVSRVVPERWPPFH